MIGGWSKNGRRWIIVLMKAERMHNGWRGRDVNGRIVMRAEESGDNGIMAAKVIKWCGSLMWLIVHMTPVKLLCLTMASMIDVLVKATLNFGHHQRMGADDIHVETLPQAPKLFHRDACSEPWGLCCDTLSWVTEPNMLSAIGIWTYLVVVQMSTKIRRLLMLFQAEIKIMRDHGICVLVYVKCLQFWWSI